jgi:hypothetical protein
VLRCELPGATEINELVGDVLPIGARAEVHAVLAQLADGVLPGKLDRDADDPPTFTPGAARADQGGRRPARERRSRMTAFDDVLDDLAARIDALAPRARAAFFLACGRALRGEYERWVARRGESHADLLARADEAAAGFATRGVDIDGGGRLLAELEAATPPGASPDEVSSTFAQDCWICVDCGVRVAVEDGFAAGICVEYALEPVTETVSERLFGFSQVGSGDEEEAQMRRLVADDRFRRAVEFCHWAIGRLAVRSEPASADLDELTARAAALAP